MQQPPEYTVSEVAAAVHSIIVNSFNSLNVIGEISDFKSNYQSGHLFFSIKDEKALIKVVCFAENAKLIDFEIKDGMKVVISGKLTTYQKSSTYQIIATKIKPAGIGELSRLFEVLKAKLQSEGLFDEIHKKKIPFLPSKIGIITSEGGAVFHDIITTLSTRFPSHIILFPAITQGKNAPESVINGIKYFNKQKNVDLIIIARGGGSYEDLFCFNDEKMVREAFKSKIPIISAIGHETDYCLLDFVADLRAPTPTAAARMSVPDIDELKKHLLSTKDTFSFIVLSAIKYYQQKVDVLNKNIILQYIDNSKTKVLFHEKMLSRITKTTILSKNTSFNNVVSLINAVNPVNILKRGFSITIDNKGNVVKSGEELENKLNQDLYPQNFTIKMHDKDVDVKISSATKHAN